jgi:hypothetical protein
MNLCIVIEVIQKRAPATTMVIIPGTHPKTLKNIAVSIAKLSRDECKLTRATMSEP